MFDTFLDDSLTVWLSFLPVRDVARCAALNSRVLASALSNSVWDPFCEQLWRGKAVLRKFVELRESGNPREAFKQSLADSHRTVITKGELLSITWSFRFKASAGENWQSNDPWWIGEPATQARFQSDGSARFARGKLFGQQPPILRWRFVRFSEEALSALNQESGGAVDDFSAFGARGVRARVMGREVPTYCIRRNKRNWGWVMESCWVVWSSWPMPLYGSPGAEELDDGMLLVTFELQQQQATSFNTGLRSEGGQELQDFPEEDENMMEDAVVHRFGDQGNAEHCGANEDLLAMSDEPAEEEPEEEDDDLPQGQVIVRFGGRYIQLPRAMLETVPRERLEELLRHSLGIPQSRVSDG